MIYRRNVNIYVRLRYIYNVSSIFAYTIIKADLALCKWIVLAHNESATRLPIFWLLFVREYIYSYFSGLFHKLAIICDTEKPGLPYLGFQIMMIKVSAPSGCIYRYYSFLYHEKISSCYLMSHN